MKKREKKPELILYSCVCALGCCTGYCDSPNYPYQYTVVRWVRADDCRKEESRIVEECLRVLVDEPPL